MTYRLARANNFKRNDDPEVDSWLQTLFDNSGIEDVANDWPVLASPHPNLELRSRIVVDRGTPVRQRSEIVFCQPFRGHDTEIVSPENGTQIRMYFDIEIPTTWVEDAQQTQIMCFRSGDGSGDYFNIYIENDDFVYEGPGGTPAYNSDAVGSGTISKGTTRRFEIRVQLERDGSTGYIEGTIDQALQGSGTPLPGQFIDRHNFTLNSTPSIDNTPFMKIGIDTISGSPAGVSERYFDFTQVWMTESDT